MAQMVKNLPAIQETWVQSLGLEDPLGKGMATHSNIRAWRIPGTEELGGLPSMGCKLLDMTEQLTHFHSMTEILDLLFQMLVKLLEINHSCIKFLS